MNQLDFPILSLMMGLPMLAAIICLFLNAQAARWLALLTTLVLFGLGVVLWANYDIGGPQWQYVERAEPFGSFAWALGIDGISMMLI
ncbi:MAG: NADH-quinone oxidoreductase subunit M, partial [Parasphingorhabdus sp.]